MLDKFFFIVGMFIAFYLSISSVQKFNLNYLSLDSFVDEFEKGYIVDLVVLEKGNECPKNYTALIKYDWPGSVKGCVCKESGAYKFYYEKCPRTDLCYEVNETPSAHLSIWGNHLICVKRSEKKYYELNLIENSTDVECDEGMKSCGRFDSLNNILCIRKEELCPLSNIELITKEQYDKENPLPEPKVPTNNDIQKNNTTSNNTVTTNTTTTTNTTSNVTKTTNDTQNPANISNNTESSKNQSITNNTSTKNLRLLLTQAQSVETQVSPTATTSTKTNKPNTQYFELNAYKYLKVEYKTDFNQTNPTIFRASTSLPCHDDSMSPESDLIYPLMKNKLFYGCPQNEDFKEIKDGRYIKFDSMNFNDFFEQNELSKIYNRITNNKAFTFLDGKEINLYTRAISGWSLKCGQQSTLKQIMKIEDSLNSMVLSSIVHSFLLLIALLSIGISACFFSEYFDKIFKLIILAFCVMDLIYPIQIISESNRIVNLFTDVDGNYCGDNYTNILLKELSNVCLDLQKNYVLILLLTILIFGVFVYTIFKWIKPYHEQYQEKYQNMIEMK